MSEIRVQHRRASASQWQIENPILRDGEIGIEKFSNKFKVGNGTTRWNSLPYFPSMNASDLTNKETLLTKTFIVGTYNEIFTLEEDTGQVPKIGDIAKVLEDESTYILRMLPATMFMNWERIGGGGGSTGPRPHVRMRSSAQVFSSGFGHQTVTNISAETQQNVAGTFRVDGHRVEILKDALYMVDFLGGWAANANGRRMLAVAYDGTTTTVINDLRMAVTGNSTQLNNAGVYALKAGDVIAMQCWQSSGANLTLGALSTYGLTLMD